MSKYIVTDKFYLKKGVVFITFYKNQEWYVDDYEVDELKLGYTHRMVPYDELKYYGEYDIIEADNEVKRVYIALKKENIEIKRGNVTLLLDRDLFLKHFKGE